LIFFKKKGKNDLHKPAHKKTLKVLGEPNIIAFIRERCTIRDRHHVIKGIGDDSAVLKVNREKALLVTADTLIEGIHFRADTSPPEALGWKALAVNVSDIGAMGGSPHTAFLSLGLKRETEMDYLESFFDGFLDFAQRADVVLAGGDIVESPSGIVVTVTLLGECRKERVVYRSGASVGDDIWVTGYVGDAAGGLFLLQGTGFPRSAQYESLILAHQRPKPPFELGRALGKAGWVTAMIDTSDGIAKDLGHICQESDVGATLKSSTIPISDGLLLLSQTLGEDCLVRALYGGEDYALLFTAPPVREQDVLSLNHMVSTAKVTRIGKIVRENGMWLERDGKKEPLELPGFLHFSQ
jgi:thiamine-monophosphate kinase